MFNHGFSTQSMNTGYGEKFWGKYRAIVTNNVDPTNSGRIKARCPAVFGPSAESHWALPSLPPGFARLPEVGTMCWLEFEFGDPDRPIWTGVWYLQGKFPLATQPGTDLYIWTSKDSIKVLTPNSTFSQFETGQVKFKVPE